MQFSIETIMQEGSMKVSNHTAQLLGAMLELPVQTKEGQVLTYGDDYEGTLLVSHKAITLHNPSTAYEKSSSSAEIVSNGLLRIWRDNRARGLPLYVALMQILGE